MIVMKKLFILFIGVYAFIFLSKQDMLPSIVQVKDFLNINNSPQIEQGTQPSAPTSQQEPNQQTAKQTESTQPTVSSIPDTSNEKYPSTEIQTYQVTVENGNLVINGKPTPYGQYNKANGVILYIQEQRANKKTTIRVPFTNGKIHYKYPLSYRVGDVILNLDELYNGKENDPNKVLGFAQFHLTDGDPYLLPSYMVQSNDPTLITLAQNITSGKSTDTEKSRAIFAWVAKNIAYNAPLVDSTNPPIYSALQTYQNRVVLCSGYADLSAALHRAVGIEAKVSYGENHAWNEIMLNGAWQNEDPTYGSGFINADTNAFVPSYHSVYFSKTDKHKEGEYPW